VSYLDDIAAASTSPSYDSLAAARAVIADLTDEEYGLARVIASEHRTGSPTELCCIGDATINGARAGGRELLDHITGGSAAFGAQGSGGGRKRPVSSARSPAARHVRAALALLRGRLWGLADPPARGIARGARRFYSPRGQLSQHRSSPSTHCSPIVILDRWTFDLDWLDRSRCLLTTTRGADQQEWVGPIDGVDAYVLMLFRKAGRAQGALYVAARRVIESEGRDQSGPSESGRAMLELAVVLAVAAALAWLLGAGKVFT
jgi:hypothetical protein